MLLDWLSLVWFNCFQHKGDFKPRLSYINPSHNGGRFIPLLKLCLLLWLKLSYRRKLKFMARVRAGIINWPGEGIPSSNINSDLNQCISVQSLSHVQLFVTPWAAACQASLFITRSLLKLMSMESVMPSNHLILCRPLLLLPSIFPSIRIFSNESVLHIRWPKYWSFSFSISPSN